MSYLTDKLRAAAEAAETQALRQLLEWAATHIESQDEALEEVREELAEEEKERLRLERALYEATLSVESALAALKEPIVPPTELGRDLAGHINIMAAHGDPDYLMASGKSIRHIDTRTKKPSKK